MFLIKMVLCRAITREQGEERGDKHLVVMQKAGRAARSLTCENKRGRPRVQARSLWVAGGGGCAACSPAASREAGPRDPRPAVASRPCRPLSLPPRLLSQKACQQLPESWCELVTEA